MVKTDQRDGAGLQARRRGGGVHVVKEAVDLPQSYSSSSVTDLKTELEQGQKHFKYYCILLYITTYFYILLRVDEFTFTERSSLPRVTLALTGGRPSSVFSWCSTVALIEFCTQSVSEARRDCSSNISHAALKVAITVFSVV